MEELEAFQSFHSYLSIVESELDLKIKQAMVDVKKLQDIYEAIKPVEDNTPKENKQITQLLNLAKGIETNNYDEKAPPPDPFTEFQNALDAFNRIPGKKHRELSHDFVSRISNYTPKTEAHVLHKLLPCVKALNHEMDMILQYDMEQPSFCLRACYGTERAESVVSAFEKELEEFQNMEIIDFPFREKAEKIPEEKPKQHQISPTIDTFANLKTKELFNLYRKRGNTRKALINTRIKEKLEEVLIPYLRSTSEEIDDIQKLRTAAKCFPILSNNPRSYALIVDEQDLGD